MSRDKELDWDNYASEYEERILLEYEQGAKEKWLNEIKARIGVESAKILDVGTGPGFLSIILADDGYELYGLDQSSGMLEQAIKNASNFDVDVTFVLGDAEKLTFADATFDVVIARNITYALSNPELAFREWLRVLKENGKILIYDANWFYFLFDEDENQKMKVFLKDYHEKNGHIHPTYEEEVAKFSEHIMSRPLSKKNRPLWDIQFWKGEKVKLVQCDSNIGCKLYGPEYAKENAPTPFFVIEVTK